MYKFIFRRILLIIPALFLVSGVIFFASEALPGDPSMQELMNRPDAKPEEVLKMKEKYNLDKPPVERYTIWLKNAIKGDLGKSYTFRRDVTSLISEKLFNTFFLGMASLTIMFALGIPLGIFSAKYEGSFFDRFVVGYNFFTLAVPSFVLGILMLYYFGYVLGWFPTNGSINPYVYDSGTSMQKLTSRIYHIILPAFTAGILSTTTIIQYLRNEIIKNKGKDFVKTARAKGQTETNIYNKHILRNSFLPISSVLGFYLTGIFAGSVITETIYSYPGMGKFFIDAINLRDTPVVTGLVLFMSILTLLGSLISDILIVSVDPRVRID